MPWRWRLAALSALPLLVGAIGVRAQADDAPSPLCAVRSTAPAGAIDKPHVSSVEGHRRIRRFTVHSPAMGTRALDIHVDVLEPDGAAGPYDVLFLLHGHGGDADDWYTHPDGDRTLESIIGARPLLVVMPDGGYDGWYSDWYGVDVDGHNGTSPYAWETFHTHELVNFIQQEYPQTKGGDRYIAGLSMGGYGAMIYAERHPELGFKAVGSFSGALDTQLDDPLEPEIQPFAQNAPDRKEPDFCIWGDGVLQHDIWTAHNPTANVGMLGDMRVFASAGDGCAPSPSNPDVAAPAACVSTGTFNSPSQGGAMFTEWGVRQQNEEFKTAVVALRGEDDPNTQFHFYGPGDHSWPYWLKNLDQFLDWVLPTHS